MKKIISFIMILVVLASLIVTASAADTDISGTGLQHLIITGCSFNRIGDGDNVNCIGNDITLSFRKLKNVHKYRYYYRLEEWNTGYSTGDWRRLGEMYYTGSDTNTRTISITIPDYQIKTLSCAGMYHNNDTFNPGRSSFKNDNMRIGVTVRGVADNGSWATDFTPMYASFSTWEFAPKVIAGWGGMNQGRNVGVYTPPFSLTDSPIKGIRLYYWSASAHDWRRCGDTYQLYGHSDGMDYTGTIVVDWKYVNDMYVDSDGDCCFTARCLDARGNLISPYMGNGFYWNYHYFKYPWYNN